MGSAFRKLLTTFSETYRFGSTRGHSIYDNFASFRTTRNYANANGAYITRGYVHKNSLVHAMAAAYEAYEHGLPTAFFNGYLVEQVEALGSSINPPNVSPEHLQFDVLRDYINNAIGSIVGEWAAVRLHIK